MTLRCVRATLCFSSRTAWVQKIKAASEQYIDTEKKKREKAYQGSRWCPRGLQFAIPGCPGDWVGSQLQSPGCREELNRDSLKDQTCCPLRLPQPFQKSWGPHEPRHCLLHRWGLSSTSPGMPLWHRVSAPPPCILILHFCFQAEGSDLRITSPTSSWSLLLHQTSPL